MSKIVLITGGASGIGKATATEFRKLGYTVISYARELDDEYPDYSYIGDVSNEAQVKSFIEVIANKYGKIDILVNNAWC